MEGKIITHENSSGEPDKMKLCAQLTMSNYCRRNYFFSFLLGALICVLACASFAANQKAKTEGEKKTPDQPKRSDQERTLTFPKAGMGTLYLVYHDEKGMNMADPVVTAIGTVRIKVPKDRWLTLELSRYAYAHPDSFESCSSSGLDGLSLNLVSIDESDSAFCDTALQHANHFRGLKCLLLNRADISDAGLSRMKGLPELEFICGFLTPITGDCFKTFSQFKKLNYVGFYDDAIKPENVKYLKDCPMLACVDLSHTDLGEVGIKYLSQCPNISVLKISSNPKVNDACIKYLLSMKHLSRLELEGTGITFSGLKALKPLHLSILRVSAGVCANTDRPVLKTLAKKVEIVWREHRVDKSTQEMFAPLH